MIEDVETIFNYCGGLEMKLLLNGTIISLISVLAYIDLTPIAYYYGFKSSNYAKSKPLTFSISIIFVV